MGTYRAEARYRRVVNDDGNVQSAALVASRLPETDHFLGSSRRWGMRRGMAAARSAAQEASLAQSLSSVLSRRDGASAHSQTMMRFQPPFAQSASLRMSRRTFFDHFSIQNATLDFGIVDSLQPCLCQKHPRTSTIVRAFGITTSGLPTNRLSQTRNRHPSANSRLRTTISGSVSLPRIFDISRLRCSGVNLSTSSGHAAGGGGPVEVSVNDRLYVRCAGVLPVEIVGVLPDVDHEKRLDALLSERSLGV